MRVFVGFLEELWAKLRDRTVAASWIFVTTILALTGPFGNYAYMEFPERLLFWGGMTAVATVIGLAISIVVDARMGTGPYWRRALMTSGILTAVMAPPLRWASGTFTKVTGETAPYFGEIESFVFFLALGVCALRELIARQTRQEIPPVVAPTADPHRPGPALLRRLPAERRAPVQWMSVRDHYVDVRTSAGATSLLMRFSDAIAELDGAPGLRVHRSFWVADEAVASVRRDAGKLTILTRDGTEIPVSRTYAADVESRCYARGHSALHA